MVPQNQVICLQFSMVLKTRTQRTEELNFFLSLEDDAEKRSVIICRWVVLGKKGQVGSSAEKLILLCGHPKVARKTQASIASLGKDPLGKVRGLHLENRGVSFEHLGVKDGSSVLNEVGIR
jgi:hypothetical protein